MNPWNVVEYVDQVVVLYVTDDNTALVLWTSGWSVGSEGARELVDSNFQGLLPDLKAHSARDTCSSVHRKSSSEGTSRSSLSFDSGKSLQPYGLTFLG